MILWKGVHDVTEEPICWNDRGKVLVDLFSVGSNKVVEDKEPTYTGSNLRLKVKDILTAKQA